jgi:HAD superfamily 5'-nucleotidase-like hydrolase
MSYAVRHPVFVNRILNLKQIKAIGLDMDHTLVQYNTERFEALVFELTIEALITHKHYPERIRELTFHMQDAIRGLVVDAEQGNILKLSRYASIRQSYHGMRAIDFKTQKQLYGSRYLDLNDPAYQVIDTSFSIAFCVLYRYLVDLKDEDETLLPNYRVLADDVLRMVDRVHADGSLKQQITDNLERFVIRDAALVGAMERFVRYGKRLFIVTNSEYYYTKKMLDYTINPYLTDGKTWETLFEYTVTLSSKPRFFYDTLKFLKIDVKTGEMSNAAMPLEPGIYQGGNEKDLTEALGVRGDDILYIGDHIYGDILRLKKTCIWRTALVVEELGVEVEAQHKAHAVEQKIIACMENKLQLEHEHIRLSTACFDEETDNYNNEIHVILKEIAALDKRIGAFLNEERQFYNLAWGQVFRAGAEESYFAYQVERYACIYMEKLMDLFACSPLTYFRANRRRLPHDITHIAGEHQHGTSV